MKNTITLNEAKRDFERGLLTGANMYFDEITGEAVYTVSVLTDLPGEAEIALVDSRSKQPRRFKSMDAAHAAVRSIGFKGARLTVKS